MKRCFELASLHERHFCEFSHVGEHHGLAIREGEGEMKEFIEGIVAKRTGFGREPCLALEFVMTVHHMSRHLHMDEDGFVVRQVNEDVFSASRRARDFCTDDSLAKTFKE